MTTIQSGSTPVVTPKVLTRAEVGRLIESAREANGLAPVSIGLQRQIQILMRDWVSRTKYLQTISTTLTIFLGIAGFGAAQALGVTPAEYKIPVFAGLLSIWVLLLGIQILLPKDLMDLAPRGELLSTQLVMQRLAAQLALYHHIESIKAEKDEQTSIREINQFIDEIACQKLASETDKLRKVVINESHSHWAESVVSFGSLGLPEGLNAQFVGIAQCVATVFEQAFPGRRFEVKLYLRMDHVLNINDSPTKIRVLTSVARFPINLDQGWGHHGKSWISCRQGPKADVWEAFDRRRILVYRCVHAADENRVYQTIACIPMPDNIGVVTVEADERSTFLPPEDRSEDRKEIESSDRRSPLSHHVVSPDLSMSVGSAVKELLVRAIRSDTPLKKRIPT